MPPGLSGLAGARVRAMPVDGLVAWVSDVERESRCRSTRCALTTRSSRRRSRGIDAGAGAVRPALRRRRRMPRRAVESGGFGRVARTPIQGFVEMTLDGHAVHAADAPRSPARASRDVRTRVLGHRTPLPRGAARAREARRARSVSSGRARRATGCRTQAGSYVRRPRSSSVTPMPLRTISHLIARARFASTGARCER